MFQVTFRDVLPSVELLAPICAAHDVVRALNDGRLHGACLSVTLTQRDEAARAPHQVLVSVVTPEQTSVVVVTEAHSLQAALRSSLALAQASRPAQRERERAPLAAASDEVHDGAWAVGA
jgi:hypothetical protein